MAPRLLGAFTEENGGVPKTVDCNTKKPTCSLRSGQILDRGASCSAPAFNHENRLQRQGPREGFQERQVWRFLKACQAAGASVVSAEIPTTRGPQEGVPGAWDVPGRSGFRITRLPGGVGVPGGWGGGQKGGFSANDSGFGVLITFGLSPQV